MADDHYHIEQTVRVVLLHILFALCVLAFQTQVFFSVFNFISLFSLFPEDNNGVLEGSNHVDGDKNNAAADNIIQNNILQECHSPALI